MEYKDQLKILGFKHKVWWIVFGACYLLISVLLIASLAVDWYSSDIEDFTGSLTQFTSGSYKGKSYGEVYDEECESDDSGFCKMLSNLSTGGSFYIATGVICLVIIASWIGVTILSLRNTKYHWCNIGTNCCLDVIFFIGFIAALAAGNVDGEECEEIPDDYNDPPALCPRAGVGLSIAIVVLLPYLVTFYISFAIIALRQDTDLKASLNAQPVNAQQEPVAYQSNLGNQTQMAEISNQPNPKQI